MNPELAPTTGPGTAGGLAASHIQNGADLILAFGGDGTVNEIAAGMVGSTVPLAVLPGGTANVFSIETKGGTNAVRSAKKLAERVPHRIAVGRLQTAGDGATTRHFLAMTGAGLDASIVHSVNPKLKRSTGKFAYWVAGFGRFLRPLQRVTLAGNGRVLGFVLVSRVRNYGGDLEIAKSASLLRDEFEVVTFTGTNPLVYAFYFLGVLLRIHFALPGIRVSKATHLELPEPGAWIQADGELVGQTPASVEIVPDALTVLLPREFKG
jgi:diacylglycerol kinase family enzyme